MMEGSQAVCADEKWGVCLRPDSEPPAFLLQGGQDPAPGTARPGAGCHVCRRHPQ